LIFVGERLFRDGPRGDLSWRRFINAKKKCTLQTEVWGRLKKDHCAGSPSFLWIRNLSFLLFKLHPIYNS
jgi:hypothetical protein